MKAFAINIYINVYPKALWNSLLMSKKGNIASTLSHMKGSTFAIIFKHYKQVLIDRDSILNDLNERKFTFYPTHKLVLGWTDRMKYLIYVNAGVYQWWEWYWVVWSWRIVLKSIVWLYRLHWGLGTYENLLIGVDWYILIHNLPLLIGNWFHAKDL